MDTNRLSSRQQLLLKKKLHLNLNVTTNEFDEPKRKVQGDAEHEHVQPERRIDSTDVVFNASDDRFKRSRLQIADVTEDVTIVPQKQQQQQQIKHNKSISLTTTSSTTTGTSSSLLKSSPTALAKFNRIIDATVPTTNVYQTTIEQQQQQPLPSTAITMALSERLALAYRNIVSTDSTFIESETYTFKTEIKEDNELENADNLYKKNYQEKRNDVHYLLKQLNSFSDIEEIEIVDIKDKQKHKEKQHIIQTEQQLKPSSSSTPPLPPPQEKQDQEQDIYLKTPQIQDEKTHSPTTQSLVLVSPSALSHKGIRRYASLHQETISECGYMVSTSMSQQLTPATGNSVTVLDCGRILNGKAREKLKNGAGGKNLLHQFDDYMFESCHYLETNYFAANYRTAMVESSSHEFRPSTTTGTSASYSSHSSLHTFDLYETEPPSVICKAPPPTSAETETHPYTIHAQHPPALGPPTRRFQMQARLTSSGVQTELTASSLSTVATNASLAASCSLSHKSTNSTTSSEAAARCRRKSFFKCCYTPIDRWRERRTAAATQKQLKRHNSLTNDDALQKHNPAGSAV